ncbi:MAG: hypothetical protein ACI97A_004109 [Planctomycetota bacterium]|jgi:hypothetical protein
MKGQDLMILLDLVAYPADRRKPYAALGVELHLSASQLHASTKRLISARLLGNDRAPRPRAVLEFVQHGLKYMFPVEVGGLALGLPTAWSAPPLDQELSSKEVVVWPHPRGKVQGFEVKPIHKVVAEVAMHRPKLHELLALVDCLRIGRARERRMAEAELKKRILDGEAD